MSKRKKLALETPGRSAPKLERTSDNSVTIQPDTQDQIRQGGTSISRAKRHGPAGEPSCQKR